MRNEFERGENSPGAVLNKRITAAAYEWHNYGKSTIGNRSDIERVPVENLRAFYRKFYQPDNVVLVVAGRFDEAKALELIQKYFGAIPRPGRKLDTTWTEEPAQDGERVVTLRCVGDVGAAGVAYHIPAGPHEDTVALQVLGNILSTQPSGGCSSVGRNQEAPARSPQPVRCMIRLMTIQAEVPRDSSLDEVRDIAIGIVEQIGERSDGGGSQPGKAADSQEPRACAAAPVRCALPERMGRQGVGSSTSCTETASNRSRRKPCNPWPLVTSTQQPHGWALHSDRESRACGGSCHAGSERAGVELQAGPPSPRAKPLKPPRQRRSAGATLELPEGIKVTPCRKTRGEEVHLTTLAGNEENLKGLEPAAGSCPN